MSMRLCKAANRAPCTSFLTDATALKTALDQAVSLSPSSLDPHNVGRLVEMYGSDDIMASPGFPLRPREHALLHCIHRLIPVHKETASVESIHEVCFMDAEERGQRVVLTKGRARCVKPCFAACLPARAFPDSLSLTFPLVLS